MYENSIESLLENKRTSNLVKVFMEMMDRYGDHLKLFGGSSIILNLASKYQNTIEYRPTKDLDFYENLERYNL